MVLGTALLRPGRGGSRALLRAFHTSAGPRAAEPEPVPLSKLKDSFNDATSVTYLEELEKRYHDDPSSVDRTWASFFKSLGARARRRRRRRCCARACPGLPRPRRRLALACRQQPAGARARLPRQRSAARALRADAPTHHPAAPPGPRRRAAADRAAPPPPDTAESGVPGEAIAEAYDAFEKGKVRAWLGHAWRCKGRMGRHVSGCWGPPRRAGGGGSVGAPPLAAPCPAAPAKPPPYPRPEPARAAPRPRPAPPPPPLCFAWSPPLPPRPWCPRWRPQRSPTRRSRSRCAWCCWCGRTRCVRLGLEGWREWGGARRVRQGRRRLAVLA
jgi:hypothetical protein